MRRTILLRSFLCGLAGLAGVLAAGESLADGTITGQGRFQKIQGQPSAGYAYLYESNLFLSRDGGIGVGPSRRLGAPPGEAPRGDGYFRIGTSAGSYSILVNQPLFFIRPKVVSDLVLEDGRTQSQNVDLALDYSTYFTDTWTPYGDVWCQTFVATGTSIVGVSWKLAGTNATRIRASVHEDDGTHSDNPTLWPLVSSKGSKVDDVERLSDNWVRWRSGEVPTVPGKTYAVRLTGVDGGDRKFAPFHRAKDSKSYGQGRAYDAAGRPQDFDLNVLVFSDNDGTAVLLSKTTVGLGDLRDGYYGGRWGQTFRATQGTSLAAVDAWAAGADGNWDLDFTWTVRKDGPSGEILGATKTTKAAYQASGAGLHGVSYNPGEVPLEAGKTYYVEFTNPIGFNPYVMDRPEDAYDGGAAYQDGGLRDGGSVDLSMTIVVHTEKGGSIEGTVRDSKSGRGLAGATVTVTGLGRTATTAADGSYRLHEITPGTFDVLASVPGYGSSTQRDVIVIAEEVTDVDFSLERTPCEITFRNESFETGLDGWHAYGGAKTSNPSGSWFGGIDPKDGQRFWGNEVNGSVLGTGGAYQRFCAEPGARYRVTAWSNIYWIRGTSTDARSRMGLHPAGGTESDSSVVWSAWDVQPSAATEGWRRLDVEVEASAPVLTVFLDFEQREGSGAGDLWRINCFDGVNIEELATVPRFLRGDCQNDRVVDLTDAVFLLAYLFQGGEPIPCESACDGNDDGKVDISDAVGILGYLFLGEGSLPPPSEACDVEPTPDALSCGAFEC